MEKEIDVEGLRKVKIKEIKYLDFLDGDPTNKKESVKRMTKLGTDLTDEEINNLTIKQALIITKELNELNGFVDFQKLA
jgi:hypothetical protein